jgi:acetyl-CoA carboxylase beta subunit
VLVHVSSAVSADPTVDPVIDRGDGRALDWETRPDDILEFGTSRKYFDTIARTDETRNLVRSH